MARPMHLGPPRANTGPVTARSGLSIVHTPVSRTPPLLTAEVKTHQLVI